MDFGLGLVLSFTDNATAGINNAVNSLNQLTNTAESAMSSMNQMASLSALSVVSNQIGSSFMKAGGSILGMFSQLLGKTQEVGSDFEGFRMTLNALYGDASEAEKQIGKLLDFSIKSPFEVNDVKDMLVVLKSQGIDAFEQIQGSISNTRQESLAWLADLMAFKPDIPVQKWKLAITNFLGSGVPKVLENALDMGHIKDIVGHAIGDTAEERMQTLVELVDKKNLAGLADSLSHTWQGVASNISDAFTKLYKSIADNGVFDKLKTSFMGVAGAIMSLDNDELEALGKTLADGLNIVVTPITIVAEKVNNLITSLVHLCQTNPEIVKFGMVFAAVAGVLLVFIGVLLKVTSAMSGLTLMFMAFGQQYNSLTTLFSVGAKRILGALLPLTLALGLMYLVWKNDLFGIQSSVMTFVQNVRKAFETARSGVGGSLENLKTILSGFDTKHSFFDGLTLAIMRVMTLGKALAEGWNSYTLSEDTFLKAKELGILPLIEAIFNLKYRFDLFKQGFIQGWNNIVERVKEVIGGIVSTLNKGGIFDSLLNGVTKFMQALSNNDPDAWKKFGEIIGELTAKFLIAVVVVKTLKAVLSKVIGVFLLFKGVTGIVQKVFSLFSRLGGIFQPLLANVGTAASSVVSFFSSMVSSIQGVLSGLAAAIGAPFSAVAAIIIAIVSTIVIYAVKHWEEFKAKVLTIVTTFIKEFMDIWNSLMEGFQRIWDNLKNAISPVLDAGNNLKQKFSELLTVLGQSEGVQALLEVLSSIGEVIVSVVVPAINGIIRVVSTTLQAVWNVVVTVFNAIVNVISSVLSSIINIIGGIFDIIVGIFTGDFNKILEGVGSILTSLANVITTILTNVWNIVQSILSGIANIFSSIFTSIVNVVGGILQGLVSVVGGIMNAISTSVSSVWSGISSIVDSVMSGMSSSIQSKWNSIKNAITNAINGARDAVKSAIDKMKSFFNFNWSLPKLKLPHLSVQGTFSITPPSVPKFGIDWYAEGGVFDKPSVIGVGEAGQEAVMPIENNTKWIGTLAMMLGREMSKTSQNRLTPANTVTNNNTSTNTTSGNSRYFTNNNTANNTYEGDTDNSVVFNQGAIQINCQNASEEEALRMAKKIMEFIQRQKELKGMLVYN